MRTLTDALGLPRDRGPRILIAGAHSDDAEIGAGGTIRRLVEERPDASVTWLVLAAPEPARDEEARASATRLLAGVAETVIDVRDLRDGYLPFLGSAPKEAVAEHAALDPDLIIGPRHDDAHQDHRLVCDLLHQVFRRAPILEYDVPKWDGDLGSTNLYVPLTAAQAAGKVAHIVESFPSQAGRDWFSRETFMAVLRLRGIECRASDGTAEAFWCRKLVVG
jgi:LmbE family N-acetylglucosaminyl deacetylase